MWQLSIAESQESRKALCLGEMAYTLSPANLMLNNCKHLYADVLYVEECTVDGGFLCVQYIMLPCDSWKKLKKLWGWLISHVLEDVVSHILAFLIGSWLIILYGRAATVLGGKWHVTIFVKKKIITWDSAHSIHRTFFFLFCVTALPISSQYFTKPKEPNGLSK